MWKKNDVTWEVDSKPCAISDQQCKDSTHFADATSESNDGKSSQNREKVSSVEKKKLCIIRIKLESVTAQCRKSPRKRRLKNNVEGPPRKGQRSIEISSDESEGQIEDLTLSGKSTQNVRTSRVLADKEDAEQREEAHRCGATEKEIFCKACDESFKTRNQLIKHRREKAQRETAV